MNFEVLDIKIRSDSKLSLQVGFIYKFIYKFTLKLYQDLLSKICKNKVTYLVDALVLDLFDWQSILDVM